MNTTKTKQTNLKEREARIQWTVLNVQQLNMLVVWQMKKPATKAFTIDYNPDRYEKGKDDLESIKDLDEKEKMIYLQTY